MRLEQTYEKYDRVIILENDDGWARKGQTGTVIDSDDKYVVINFGGIGEDFPVLREKVQLIEC